MRLCYDQRAVLGGSCFAKCEAEIHVRSVPRVELPPLFKPGEFEDAGCHRTCNTSQYDLIGFVGVPSDPSATCNVRKASKGLTGPLPLHVAIMMPGCGGAGQVGANAYR